MKSHSPSLTPTIRLSMPADRDAILAFIERMGFNPRDAVTWDGLHMLAMTAWHDGRLIGAIPLEPRVLRIGPDRSIASLHETVVAVDSEYRNAGVGSRMQQAIADRRPAGAELVTVFREEPQSPAYRWYLKNGFTKAMQIDAWLCDEPATIATPALPQTWEFGDPTIPWREVEQAWRSHPAARSPGRIDRESRGLQDWLAVHPYRHRYSFGIVADSLGSFALLGVGAMHSETIRADVLEMMPVDAIPLTTESLLREIAARSANEGWRPIRLPLATSDPWVAVASSTGVHAGRSFDMLIRALGNFSISGKALVSWSYAGVDYI